MSAIPQTIKRALARLLSLASGPRIIYGWQNERGGYCPNTRFSTHTCFE